MTITFASDKDVIVYALEKIISYTRDNRYIFLAQGVWSISGVIGLQEGIVIHIDNLRARGTSGHPEEQLEPMIHLGPADVHPDCIMNIQDPERDYILSDSESVCTTETDIHNEVIDNCEILLGQSKKERKAIGRITRQATRVVKRQANKKANWKKPLKTFGTQTEGIDLTELRTKDRSRRVSALCLARR